MYHIDENQARYNRPYPNSCIKKLTVLMITNKVHPIVYMKAIARLNFFHAARLKICLFLQKIIVIILGNKQ